MALPSSGSILLSQVNTELGRTSTATISLGESAVRTLFGKSSGAISMSDGYGKANQFAFTISSNQTNANLRTLAINAGWNQSSKVVATIGSGVYISSNSTGTPALTVSGSFPGGVELINNGYIVGMGGAGGTGGAWYGNAAAGASGGGALSVSSVVSITNNGTVAGGGGGGGGSGVLYYSFRGKIDSPGGNGGGGGRSSAAANSAGGAGTAARNDNGNGYPNGVSGGVGTYSVAGNGGNNNWYYSPPGGNGGGWGANGSSGTQPPTPEPGGGYITYGAGGGSGGYSISGNSNITWVATGTRLGSIS